MMFSSICGPQSSSRSVQHDDVQLTFIEGDLPLARFGSAFISRLAETLPRRASGACEVDVIGQSIKILSCWRHFAELENLEIGDVPEVAESAPFPLPLLSFWDFLLPSLTTKSPRQTL